MRAMFGWNFRTGLLIGLIAVVTAGAGAVAAEPPNGTIAETMRRGAVHCGVSEGLPGFSAVDKNGRWSGFDVDFCRALAAAIFDDPNKVNFVPVDARERFTDLANRKFDVLARNTTWTMSRETEYGLQFAGVSYYDGQGFMVPRARNIDSALALDGSKVCVQAGTTTEVNLADFFKANHMAYEARTVGSVENLLKNYEDGQCDVLTADVSQLYALRLKSAKPGAHVILADVISKEPLGPVVRQKDDDWLLLVKWTLFAMINAEELGITSQNIDQALKSAKPDVRRFVGTDGDYGTRLGLKADWAIRIIRHVGNYGEVFERNVGSGSPLGIPRGLNQLWNAGGILYAPPIR